MYHSKNTLVKFLVNLEITRLPSWVNVTVSLVNVITNVERPG